MPNTKTRLPLYVNQFEQELLYSAQFVSILSGNEFFYVPEMKEVLQAILYETFHTVRRNRNSLKGFVNGLSRRKAPTEIEYDQSEVIMPKRGPKIYNRGIDESKYPINPYEIGKPKNLVFPLENEDMILLNDLDEMVHSIEDEVRFRFPKFTQSEIMKEAIYFILGNKNKFRTHYFLNKVYIGSWYNINPLSSVRIFEVGDYDRENLFDSLNEQEHKQLLMILEDKKIFDNFVKKAKKKPYNYKDIDSFIELEKGAHSEFGGINYQLATIGMWVLSDIEEMGMDMLPYTHALAMRFPLKIEGWLDLVDTIEFEVSFLMELGKDIKMKIEGK